MISRTVDPNMVFPIAPINLTPFLQSFPVANIKLHPW